jgi:hypothetical protein
MQTRASLTACPPPPLHSDIELAATHVHRLHTSSRSLTLRAVIEK